jgi:hypothetical protein
VLGLLFGFVAWLATVTWGVGPAGSPPGWGLLAIPAGVAAGAALGFACPRAVAWVAVLFGAFRS